MAEFAFSRRGPVVPECKRRVSRRFPGPAGGGAVGTYHSLTLLSRRKRRRPVDRITDRYHLIGPGSAIPSPRRRPVSTTKRADTAGELPRGGRPRQVPHPHRAVDASSADHGLAVRADRHRACAKGPIRSNPRSQNNMQPPTSESTACLDRLPDHPGRVAIPRRPGLR